MNPLDWLRHRIARASSRAAAADVYPHERITGRGADWRPTSYGEYYAKSPPVFTATRVRADALTRAPLRITDPAGTPIPPNHPLQRLFDNPSSAYTGTDLIRATETFLCLWGTAYWAIETHNDRQELWPIRPDRLTPLPGTGRTYVKGYIYRAQTGDEVAYLPEEIVPIHLFNPLQDRAGLSPIAPLRLTVDMANDAIRYNRRTFVNGGIPDYLLFADQELTDEEIDRFYERWEKRFSGPQQSHRPAFVSAVRDMKSLAFSQREMEFIDGLQWSVETVSSVYGVPQPFMGSLREATLTNIEVLERIFWRTTLIPELIRLQDKITHDAIPKLGYPAGRYRAHFDTSEIEVLTEQEEPRLKREAEYLDRGVLSINEVRESRGLPPIDGGDDRDAPARRRHPTRADQPEDASRRSAAHNGARPSDDRVPSPAHR